MCMNRCCGNCQDHERDDRGDYRCTNPDSEYEGVWTPWKHYCEEWVERELLPFEPDEEDEE